MKQKYMDADFLLDTKAARELYHAHAEQMPIIDYHCHLPPAEIACDKRWSDIAEVWLGGDHYKWRQMRSNGVEERCCTGDAPWREKFVKYAETMERLVKNPLFDWSHLELSRYFGINERLCGASAERIWKKCNAKLRQKSFSAQGLMKKSNVKVVCTTDDPIDSLEHHIAVAKKPFGTQIRPAWRSDKASKIENLKVWNAWMDALSKAANTPVKTFDDFLDAMAKRHAFFAKNGCVVSDYGITEVFAAPYTIAEVSKIFRKARSGRAVTAEEALKFKSAWLFEGLKADAKANWTAQLHVNCLRDNNSAMFAKLGPDTGFDCIGDWSFTESLSRLFDRLESEDSLPRTILYSLNPKDTEMMATLMGCFQKAPDVGKIQLGSAWWFLDQKDGMTKQLEALASLGCLGNFVGMLTDSRSFLSYTRHEYFRRILCQMLGRGVDRGEIPADMKWLGGIVEDISFNNANRYFGFGC
jgi:glucuronate isomerase